MGMTAQQRCAALGAAVLVLLILLVAHHRQWMKAHCVCASSKFHGWRYQHYDDNPYTQQRYHCGLGALGDHYPRQKPDPHPPSHYPRGEGYSAHGHCTEDGHCAAHGHCAEHFGGDTDNWPGSGTYGALADTFPYGNYADGKAMFYPTYDEYNPYWTRS